MITIHAHMYRICPFRISVPNRSPSPSRNKHTTSNSHLMPDKTSKDQETLKFEQYSSLFHCHTYANRHVLVNKGPHCSCLLYMRIYVYAAIRIIIKITALLLRHIWSFCDFSSGHFIMHVQCKTQSIDYQLIVG